MSAKKENKGRSGPLQTSPPPPQQVSQFYDLTASPRVKRKESVGEEMSHVPLREKVFPFFFRESGVKSILCGLFFRGEAKVFPVPIFRKREKNFVR